MQEPDKSTCLVLPPTTGVCSALRIFLVYADIFMLNGEKSDCCWCFVLLLFCDILLAEI